MCLSKGVFFVLLLYVFQKPYDYLVLDRDNNKYYQRLNKIIVCNKQDAAKSFQTTTDTTSECIHIFYTEGEHIVVLTHQVILLDRTHFNADYLYGILLL